MGETREPPAKRLFEGLIWPAVAGNVAWSFLTVTVQEGWSGETVYRLLALVLVAAYLMVTWMRMTTRRFEPSLAYFVADGVYAIAIAVFAIATQDRAASALRWVDALLAAVFVASLYGHLSGVWESGLSRRHRWSLAAVNVFGLMILLIGPVVSPDGSHRPLALGMVIGLWGLVEVRARPPGHVE